jgi:uncharacterized protein YkwD
MSRARAVLLCCFVVPCFALAAPPAHAQEEATAAAASQAMVRQINGFRAAHHRRPLRQSPALVRQAARHSRWMLARNVFAHSSRSRLRGFRRLGEVIAMSSGWRPAVRATLTRWKHSPSHRRVLLSRGFSRLGAASMKGRFGSRPATVWTVRLGKR